MRQKCYLTLATGRVWLISYKLHLSHMGRDVGQIFRTASLHRDHSILYAFDMWEKDIWYIFYPGIENLNLHTGYGYLMFYPGIENLNLHTGYRYLWFYPGIENLILPRLSCEDFTLVVLELTHMFIKWCHCYVKWSYHVASQGIQELLGAFF